MHINEIVIEFKMKTTTRWWRHGKYLVACRRRRCRWPPTCGRRRRRRPGRSASACPTPPATAAPACIPPDGQSETSSRPLGQSKGPRCTGNLRKLGVAGWVGCLELSLAANKRQWRHFLPAPPPHTKWPIRNKFRPVARSQSEGTIMMKLKGLCISNISN